LIVLRGKGKREEKNGEGKDPDEENRERDQQASYAFKAPQRAAEESLRALGALRC